MTCAAITFIALANRWQPETDGVSASPSPVPHSVRCVASAGPVGSPPRRSDRTARFLFTYLYFLERLFFLNFSEAGNPMPVRRVRVSEVKVGCVRVGRERGAFVGHVRRKLLYAMRVRSAENSHHFPWPTPCVDSHATCAQALDPRSRVFFPFADRAYRTLAVAPSIPTGRVSTNKNLLIGTRRTRVYYDKNLLIGQKNFEKQQEGREIHMRKKLATPTNSNRPPRR